MTVDTGPQGPAPDEGRQSGPVGPDAGRQGQGGPDETSAAEYPHDAPVLLEEDETVPPRPEEEAADLLRAEPEPH